VYDYEVEHGKSRVRLTLTLLYLLCYGQPIRSAHLRSLQLRKQDMLISSKQRRLVKSNATGLDKL